MKAVLGHVDAPLDTVSAAAFVGGTALYLLGTVAFKLRTLRTVSVPRLVAAAAVLALLVPARHVDAIVVLAGAAALLWLLIGYEAFRLATTRDRIRHGERPDGPDPAAAGS